MKEKEKLVRDTIAYLKQQPPEEVVLRNLITGIAPSFTLREEPLPDTEAKKKHQRVGAEIAIIYFGDEVKEMEFLKNLTKAINVGIRSAEIADAHKIESEKGWKSFLESPELKWIIAPKRGLRKSTELVQFYKELPVTKERFLGLVPIFFIEPIAEYFKNPQLKKALWEELCKTLK